MYVPNKMPIYTLPINSLKDIDDVLQSREQEQQKISGIQKFRYYKAIQTPYYLCIANLFKDTYWNSLGFTPCLEAVSALDSYQELLKRSITVFNDILTPLFIRSFKCHRKAADYFSLNLIEATAAKMAKSGKLAGKIAKECKNFREESRSLRGKIVQLLRDVVGDQVQIYEKQREFSKNQKKLSKATSNSLNSGISFLDISIKSLGKLTTVLGNVYLFWSEAEIHCENLAEPFLADPDNVELMASSEPGHADERITELVKELSVVESTLKQMNSQPKNLDEVAKTMKTGSNLTTQPTQESFSSMIAAELSKGLEQEFEDSYLNWLALAKINQTVIAATQEALGDVEEKRNDISTIEEDHLVRTLHIPK